MYVLKEERRVRWTLGFARLSFTCGALLVAFFLYGALTHLGERQSRDWFNLALAVGFSWWAVHRAIAWIARGFVRRD